MIACIVYGCTNKKSSSIFIGDICKPCHTMITEGTLSQPSNNIFAALFNENKKLRKELTEIIKILFEENRKLEKEVMEDN